MTDTTKRDHVDVWVYEDHLQVDVYDHPHGAPCLSIPLRPDAILDWIRALTTALEDGEIDRTLPGRFGEAVGDD